MTNRDAVPVAEFVFLCADCKAPFATRNPDAWLMNDDRVDGAVTRRYCDCGRLLVTQEDLRRKDAS